MFSLSSPPLHKPPSPPPLTPSPKPPEKQSIPVSLNQIIISKQPKNRETPPAYKTQPDFHNPRKQPILLPPRPRRTNPWTWLGAILCFVFSLMLIFFGIATVTIFLSIKPKIPLFDIPTANLNTLYFDSPEYFNGDFTFLANFTNPNRVMDVRFECLDLEVYFFNRLISTQSVQPFYQRRRETRLESVHVVMSLVYFPANLGRELRKQVLNNTISYDVSGRFKVRASVGLVRFSYWLHARCRLTMTGPPTGVLVAHSCTVKR